MMKKYAFLQAHDEVSVSAYTGFCFEIHFIDLKFKQVG